MNGIHKNKQHYIPIIDAAIGKPAQGDKYMSYDRGTEMNVWIKNDDGKEFIGGAWPG